MSESPRALPLPARERTGAGDRHPLRWLALVVLLFLPSAASAETVALPVDGEPFAARLAAVDADFRVTLQPPGEAEARSMPAADLVCWGQPAAARRGPLLVTADGGLLVADPLAIDPAEVTVYADLFGKLTLPVGRLAGVVFAPPADAPGRDRLLLQVERATGSTDQVLLDNDDQLAGTIERLADDTLHLRTETGVLKVDTGRITALVFNPDLRQPAAVQELRAWVGFADGSRLIASRLVVDEKTAALSAVGVEGLKTAPGDLVFLQPLGGRAVYLSDLREAGYRHLPYLGSAWPYRRDQSVTGLRLRAGGRLFLKGLGLHSAARLSYDLPGEFRQFQAELAVDDSAEGQGSVQLRVYVDRKLRFSSETVRGGQAPVPVRVETVGAKRLDLIVDFADKAHVLDHADLLDARLVEE